MKTFVKALAHYHPEDIISNDRFENSLDTTSKWIVERTGILERRVMSDYQEDFPVLEISKRALAKLKLDKAFDKKKIGFIISASTHDDIHYPNAGNLIAEELDLNVPVFQIKSACTSVAYAIHVARALLQLSDYTDVLIVNGEPFTRYVDYGDRSSCILFGDAGTACIVSKESGVFEIISSDVGGRGMKIVQATRVSDTSHLTASDIITGELSYGKPEQNRRRNSDKKFQQEGKKVVEFVANEIPKAIFETLEKSKTELSELDYIVLHQSNLIMMNSLVSKLPLDVEKHLFNVDRFGNTSSAGWVTVLSQNQSKIKKNDKTLVSVFGAGMTWANLILKKSI